ncbi:MAG: hypothetical protein R3C45_18405 [Phycisphaerales bacterium]
MIVTEQQHQLDDVLTQVAIELDIPPHKYTEAMISLTPSNATSKGERSGLHAAA